MHEPTKNVDNMGAGDRCYLTGWRQPQVPWALLFQTATMRSFRIRPEKSHARTYKSSPFLAPKAVSVLFPIRLRMEFHTSICGFEDTDILQAKLNFYMIWNIRKYDFSRSLKWYSPDAGDPFPNQNKLFFFHRTSLLEKSSKGQFKRSNN